MFFRNRGLIFKQSLYILTATAMIFIPVMIFVCITTASIIKKDTQKIAEGITESKANELDQEFMLAMNFASQTALMLEKGHYDIKDIADVLQSSMAGMKNVRGIYACSIAFAPYAFEKNKKYSMTYVFKQHNMLVHRMLGGKDYPYFTYNWFKVPRDTGKPAWTKPYYDRGGGNTLMTTYSVPFYKKVAGNKSFQGVVTVDISLKWLKSVISSMRIFPSSRAFIVSRSGRFIAHSNSSKIMKNNLLDEAKMSGDQNLINNIKTILNGEKGFFSHYSTQFDEKIWACHTPLKTTKWSLAVAFSDDELFAGLVKMELKLVVMALAGFALLLCIVLIITVRVTKPLRQLTEAAEKIADGKFDINVPQLSSHDEISVLSLAFDSMRHSLIEYIDNLAKTTAAKEKIESELKIARDLQMNFLPDANAVFNEYKEFSLAAFIKPARAVGGDLYDFFFIGEHRLCVTVADVSGKGVPAALFMAAACKLLRGIADNSMSTGELMTKLSKGMEYNNDMMMFVTCFCAVLDINTGQLEYTNAGHNPPYMIKADGKPVEIAESHGPPMAISDTEYGSSSMLMAPGDTLMLYTDGVSEAMNCNRKQFGNDRMLAVLREQSPASPQDYITALKNRLKEFTSGVEPSDDITMLAVRYQKYDQE